MPSLDVVNFSCTISDVSSFSEHSVDHSGPFEPPAVSKLIGRRSPTTASLSQLSMRPCADVLDRCSTNDGLGYVELELVKERFSKLDMSGNGKGICTAPTVFRSCHKLEPLPAGKKMMWRKEMDCLISFCDYIVEFYPSTQMFSDGTKVEVMATRPGSDIYINLPTLEKLDAMLIIRSQ